MITQCSHCSTKFEISKELVESQDPRVRCGECLNVFNARLQLVVEPEFSEPAVPTVTQKVAQTASREKHNAPALELESYVSGDDIENAATLAFDDHPSGTQGSASSAQARGNDGFYSPDLDHRKVPGNENSLLDSTTLEFERTLVLASDNTAGLTEAGQLQQTDIATDSMLTADESTTSEMPDVSLQQPQINDETLDQDSVTRDSAVSDVAKYEDDSAVSLRNHVSKRGGEVLPLSKESESKRRSTQQKSMFIPLVCCAAALIGVLYLAKDQVAKLDLPEPVLSAFCGVTGCELDVAKDLSRLELRGHKMSSHPTLSDVLVIDVEVINRAPFPQPYPVLSVTMSDTAGETVATRQFQPADYLEPEAIDNTLPSDQLVRISFEILDPGPEASSSELVFE